MTIQITHKQERGTHVPDNFQIFSQTIISSKCKFHKPILHTTLLIAPMLSNILENKLAHSNKQMADQQAVYI